MMTKGHHRQDTMEPRVPPLLMHWAPVSVETLRLITSRSPYLAPVAVVTLGHLRVKRVRSLMCLVCLVLFVCRLSSTWSRPSSEGEQANSRVYPCLAGMLGRLLGPLSGVSGKQSERKEDAPFSYAIRLLVHYMAADVRACVRALMHHLRVCYAMCSTA